MICKNCGTSNDDGVMFCTSCGAQMNEASFDGDVVCVPEEEPAKGLAIASMIMGIVSLALCNFLCIPPIVGLILAIVAKKKGNKSGMATAGMIMSVISIILGVLGAIFWIGYYVFFFVIGMSM